MQNMSNRLLTDRVELVKFFTEFERRNDLFDRKAGGVYYWHFLRKWIFDLALSGIRAFEFGGHPDYKNQLSATHLLRKIVSLICNSAKSFFSLHSNRYNNKEILFVGAWKKIEQNGKVINFLLEELGNDLKDSCLILERPANLVHKKDSLSDVTIFTDCLEVIWGVSLKLGKYRHQANQVRSDVFEVISKLENELNIKLDRSSIFHRVDYVVAAYYSLGKQLEKFFLRINPKCVVETEHYSVFSLVCNGVLKQLEIPIIELQHGQIGHGHIAYNISASNSRRYLPDKIAAFGQYWIDQCELPNIENIMVPVGSIPLQRDINRLHKLSSEKPKRKRSNKVLLVISQGYDNGAIDNFVSSCAKADFLKDWKILVKLHPSEVLTWRHVHPALASNDHVEIITSGSSNWYVVNSDAVVGISSTVLFEALAFQKPIFVLDDIDSEIAEPLISLGVACRIVNADDMVDFLQNFNNMKEFDSEYYWKSNALSNVEMLIKNKASLRSS